MNAPMIPVPATITAVALPPGIAALIPDGVYFGLDEDRYHADPALGSSDMKRLARNPVNYWWESSWNPIRREESDKPALVLGKAVHRFVLDGEAAFHRDYAPVELSGNTKAAKEEREAVKASGRTPLKLADYQRVLASASMIRFNPHLREAFSEGAPEVSVFWTREGIRRKARIDYLKPLANVDLKSISNPYDLDFVQACIKAVAGYGYDVQAEHYLEARSAAREHIRFGRVAGAAVGVDARWLAACAEPERYAHVLVFWQSTGAPLTHSLTLSAGNAILDEVGRGQIVAAENNYRNFVKTFGLNQPWVLMSEPEELHIDQMPSWYGMR